VLNSDDALENLCFEAALTDAEAEAFKRVYQGRGLDEIARELGVSYHTVRCYLSRANVKVRRLLREAEADQWPEDADGLIAILARSLDPQDAERSKNFPGTG